MVNSIEHRGGLFLLWKFEINVRIQHHSQNHIYSYINLPDGSCLRYTGFYGFPELNHKSESWDILRLVGSTIRED